MVAPGRPQGPPLQKAVILRRPHAWDGTLSMEVQMALTIGDEAPDFRLSSTTGATQGEFQLSAYRGKNVVLCFYVLDFTPV